jgi:hypothetical protein
MHQSNHGIFIMNLRERLRQPVSARRKIRETAKPNGLSAVRQADILIFENPDVIRLQSAADTFAVESPIMIAKNSKHSQRGMQRREFSGDRFAFGEPSTSDALNNKISRYNDEIGVYGIRRRDDFLDIGQASMRRSHVQIRPDGYSQSIMLGMPGVQRNRLLHGS